MVGSPALFKDWFCNFGQNLKNPQKIIHIQLEAAT